VILSFSVFLASMTDDIQFEITFTNYSEETLDIRSISFNAGEKYLEPNGTVVMRINMNDMLDIDEDRLRYFWKRVDLTFQVANRGLEKVTFGLICKKAELEKAKNLKMIQTIKATVVAVVKHY
jgi:hypothetical protein